MRSFDSRFLGKLVGVFFLFTSLFFFCHRVYVSFHTHCGLQIVRVSSNFRKHLRWQFTQALDYVT